MRDTLREVNKKLLAAMEENETLREWLREATAEQNALRKRVSELVALVDAQNARVAELNTEADYWWTAYARDDEG